MVTALSSDWLELKTMLPGQLANLCDYASDIDEKIDGMMRDLARNDFDVNKFVRLMAESKFALEYVSIIRPHAPGGDSKQVEEFVQDLQQTFRILDDEKERNNLRTTIDQQQGYGQVYLYLQKLVELLHGYFHRSLVQAMHSITPSPDEYYMEQFAKAAAADAKPLLAVEHKEVNWRRLMRSKPRDLRAMCETADDLQYLLSVRRNYELEIHTRKIWVKTIVLASQYLHEVRKRQEKTDRLFNDMMIEVDHHLQQGFNTEAAAALAKKLMYGRVYATILAADQAFEKKFMDKFITASLNRRGVAPLMKEDDSGSTGLTIEKED